MTITQKSSSATATISSPLLNAVTTSPPAAQSAYSPAITCRIPVPATPAQPDLIPAVPAQPDSMKTVPAQPYPMPAFPAQPATDSPEAAAQPASANPVHSKPLVKLLLGAGSDICKPPCLLHIWHELPEFFLQPFASVVPKPDGPDIHSEFNNCTHYKSSNSRGLLGKSSI